MSEISTEKSVEAIVQSLTLEEKVSLLAGSSFHDTTEILAKGVPAIKSADGPNGIRAPATTGEIRAACFPAASSLAATWDTDLARSFGNALAIEALRHDVNCVLGPTVCIHRHPLGGRNFESFSEDPLLTRRMAAQVIQGLQENGVAAVIKHFVANEQETDRTTVNETISQRALREIFLRPFEIAVKESHPWALMTAYNMVNGTHCDSNPGLLRDILGGEWGWNGLVMSDWGGTNTVAEALDAGLDLEMPGPPRLRKIPELVAAMQKGDILKQTIDERATAVVRLATKLESLAQNKSRKQPEHNSDDQEKNAQYQRLIRDTGAKGMVLLKNDENLLPLTKDKLKGKKLALVGFAKEALAHGGGSAAVNAYYKLTPWELFQSALGDEVELLYAKGAHCERLLPPLQAVGSPYGEVRSLDGSPGFTLKFVPKGDGKEQETVRHGYSSSAYNPLGSREAREQTVEIIGDFTPSETGSHYLTASGFGPTSVLIDGELVVEQKENTNDPMGCLFGAVVEPKAQHRFVAGRTYRIHLRTEPPKNISLDMMEGRSGGRLGFWPESIHDADLVSEAADVASKADFVIVFTGHHHMWETEGQDQASFHLPQNQDALIHAVARANSNTVVVNSTGVAVAMPWLSEIKGLIQAWFPGQECGNAICDVVTGVKNPEGRLPVSFPRRLEDAPAHGNFPGERVNGQLQVTYAEGVFIGYRHYDRVPRGKLNFPFGHGLSHTTYEIQGLKVLGTDGVINTFVQVSNTGPRAGKMLIQLYVGRAEVSPDNPVKTLVAFKKVHVEAGESHVVDMSVQTRDFAVFKEDSHLWTVEQGVYRIYAGLSSVDIQQTAEIELTSATWKP